MSIWGKNYYNSLLGITDRSKKRNTISKFKILLIDDVEAEGKKIGFEKAAKKYEAIYRELEIKYQETKSILETQRDSFDNVMNKLICKLQLLEKEKESLEELVKNNIDIFSEKYNISPSNVKSILGTGSLFIPKAIISIGILDIICSNKERKLKKAENEGYLEAREIYEKKIKELHDKYILLKNKGNEDIKKLIDLLVDVCDEIADNQIKIIELKLSL